jgi:hypothetical protein
MKLVTLFCFFAISAATSAMSEGVDVSSLSDYEKKVHRIGWCQVVAGERLFDFDTKDILEVVILLSDQGFLSNSRDVNRIREKISADAKASFILKELSVTQKILNECNYDLQLILKDEYVPNFSYMGD